MKPLKIRRVPVTLVLATAVAAAALLATPALLYAQQEKTAARSGGKKPAASRKGKIPAALVGSWTWGSVNPGRYVDKTTGEYVGNAGGGAVSYTFTADGAHKRHVLIHFGAGFSNESIFSAMEGTADFDEAAGTFTVRLTRGQITFEKKAGLQKRPLSRQELEQGVNAYTYRLEKDEDGKAVLMINDKGKPASEGRRFYKDAGS